MNKYRSETVQELPTMLSAAYASNTVDSALWGGIEPMAHKQANFNVDVARLLEESIRAQQPTKQEKQVMANAARIVKVFVADTTSEDIPLESRVLYTGVEKLTDSTDQELFFDVPIGELLAKHNDYRKAVVDKRASDKYGKDIYLEPIRIRDLKMVVVTVASF